MSDDRTPRAPLPRPGRRRPRHARAGRARSAPTCSRSPPSWSATTRSSGSPTAPASPSRPSTAPRWPGWSALGAARPPTLYAGHSLGELAALAAAGAVDDARRPADRRRARPADGRRRRGAAAGGMLAVGGDREQAAARSPQHAGLVLANENSPEPVRAQRAAGGDRGGARPRRRERGLRAKRLAVARRLSLAGDGGRRRAVPRASSTASSSRRRDAPVISCGHRRARSRPTRASQLAAALTSPVRWVEVLRAPAGGGRRALLRRRARARCWPGSSGEPSTASRTVDPADREAAHA